MHRPKTRRTITTVPGGEKVTLFRFAKNPKAKMMSLISVKGNKFINAKGDTVLFRGVSIADPDKIDHEGHWNKMLFEKVKDMGVMLVRIPVHPVAWRERTPLKYLSLLDSAVTGVLILTYTSISTGIPLAILKWNFSKTRCIILHEKKLMNSGK